MKNKTKDNLAFWATAGVVGAASGFIAWLCSAPLWLIIACTLGAPVIIFYVLMIAIMRGISNI